MSVSIALEQGAQTVYRGPHQAGEPPTALDRGGRACSPARQHRPRLTPASRTSGVLRSTSQSRAMTPDARRALRARVRAAARRRRPPPLRGCCRPPKELP
jgi:hypothetical protein